MDVLKALEKVVGPKRVTNSEAVCQSYKYNCFLGKEWEMKPDIVVLAETTEEVSGIIKAANQHGVPVRHQRVLWVEEVLEALSGAVFSSICHSWSESSPSTSIA
jgi:hypothetical protein